MIPGVRRVCLGCGTTTLHGSRCAPCQAQQDRTIEARRGERPHYAGDYRKRAAFVRATTTSCAVCGQGARPGDPWQADHVREGDPASPLQGVHRTCNVRKFHESKRKVATE